jgi:hypothetical protein
MLLITARRARSKWFYLVLGISLLGPVGVFVMIARVRTPGQKRAPLPQDTTPWSNVLVEFLIIGVVFAVYAAVIVAACLVCTGFA